MTSLDKLIRQTERQLQLNILLKSLAIGIGMGLLLSGLGLNIILASAGLILGLALALFMLGRFRPMAANAREYLHLHYPELEFSLEILDKPQRTLADEFQLMRVASAMQDAKSPRIWHKRMGSFLLFLVVGTGVFAMGLRNIGGNLKQEITPISVEESKTIVEPPEALKLNNIELLIQSPVYTGLKIRSQNELDIRAIEGSRIDWRLIFSHTEFEKLVVVDAAGNQVPFDQKEDEFLYTDRLESSGIYAIRAYNADTILFETDFHRLEMVKDKSPVIVPEEKELYKFHFHADPKRITLKASISDDFLVRQAHIIATLARGSGENVKFREIRIPLSEANFKTKTVRHAVDLKALDFQPGDELYYYWVAIDNKAPEPNISKSETYFIQYVDSTGLSESQLATMAISVLPEYFRSQRQIIIDTEKLLKEKDKISEKEFNSRSNEIGHDQKLLRMRYGQYLGEEFESNAPGGSLNSAEGRNILESFIHNHDQEGENEGAPSLSKFRYTALQKYQQEHDKNQEILKKELAEMPDHNHELHDHETEGDELAGLLEEYLHNHDSEEMNTLYEQSTRGTLKMALEEMWQSELHMRLFEPKTALPYQHKALEFLKSVQQKSRVYVKRTGFDSPPIKEAEKRLTGELKDMGNFGSREFAASSDELATLAASLMGMMHNSQLSTHEKSQIDTFGELWVKRMAYSGMDDWQVLVYLQKLNSGELNEKEQKDLAKKLQILIPKNRRNNPTLNLNRDLAKAFWENLK